MSDFEQKGNDLIKRVVLAFKWMLPIMLIIITVIYCVRIIGFIWLSDTLNASLSDNPFVSLGLPLAALVSLGLVLALEQTSEKIKFKAIGFEFEGASGQIVLWVLCYLSIVLSLKLFA